MPAMLHTSRERTIGCELKPKTETRYDIEYLRSYLHNHIKSNQPKTNTEPLTTGTENQKKSWGTNESAHNLDPVLGPLHKKPFFFFQSKWRPLMRGASKHHFTLF